MRCRVRRSSASIKKRIMVFKQELEKLNEASWSSSKNSKKDRGLQARIRKEIEMIADDEHASFPLSAGAVTCLEEDCGKHTTRELTICLGREHTCWYPLLKIYTHF